MKIGIVSDSHDNLPAINKAISMLNTEGVDVIVHAGDIISPFSAKLFLGLNFPVYFTFGNNDGEKVMLKEVLSYSDKCNLVWPKSTINIGNFKVALMHGEDEEMVEALALSGIYDLVVYGHWHKTVNKLVNNCLVINPGELCGYLTGRLTFAIADLDKKEAKIVDIK